MDFDFSKPKTIQDPTHIGTKMRNKFLKPNAMFPMGSYIACSSHLQEIMKKYSKNMHFLSPSILNPVDRMNFRSVLSIISDHVLNCLSKEKNMQGTLKFLQIMQYVLDSFMDKGLQFTERIYKLWYAVFFLRQWRYWIKKSNEYTLTDNFITLNAYTCIELNAHNLLILTLNYIENNSLDELYPWHLGSQNCEEWFRAARSLTSTFSTIVNFTSEEFTYKSKRIEFIYEATHSLSEEYIFPRSQKKNISVNSQKHIKKQDIFDAIEKAKQNSINEIKALGMKVLKTAWKVCDLNNVSEDDENKKYTASEDIIPFIPPNFNLKEDLIEQIKNLNFKTSTKVPADLLNSCFVQIDVEGIEIIIKKSCLVWILSGKGERVSTDRLLRFKSSTKQKNGDSINIENESYYAIYFEDQFYLGRVLSMSDGYGTIKFLKQEFNEYIWPRKDDICKVKMEFIFFGPLTLGNYPFKLRPEVNKEILIKYKHLKYKSD